MTDPSPSRCAGEQGQARGQDVATLLDFLDTPPGQAARGWIQWQQYWDGIDSAQRRRELTTNPYYIT